MNTGIFKYILICCFALTLLFKASDVLSVFNKSISQVEYSDSDKESTEKEEKQAEAEYLDDHFVSYNDIKSPVLIPTKVLLPLNFFTPAYFPEVLTPPPSSLV